jgi:hypothetical protein
MAVIGRQKLERTLERPVQLCARLLAWRGFGSRRQGRRLLDGLRLRRYDPVAMSTRVEHIDAQQRFDEKERARRADAEALRSGQKTEAQLKRETDAFASPPSRARINLDSARSLS